MAKKYILEDVCLQILDNVYHERHWAEGLDENPVIRAQLTYVMGRGWVDAAECYRSVISPSVQYYNIRITAEGMERLDAQA